MSTPSPPRFKRRFPVLMRRAPGPDWGDMGTAVALEYALDQPPQAAPRPDDPMPTASAPVFAWRLWPGRKRGG